MKCFSPESIRKPQAKSAKERITVRCGKCFACLMKRRNDWSVRLQQELKSSGSADFVTLTYSDDTLPYVYLHGEKKGTVIRGSEVDENERYNLQPTLLKADLQNYFKKLRLTNDEDIKYYGVGEYGEHTRRPHYHIILFGADSITDITIHWSDCDRRSGEYIFKGKIHVGKATEAAIHYVTGYLIGKDFEYGKYVDTNVEAPFSVMSKGLGENYMYENYSWHKSTVDRKFTMLSNSGKMIGMPRYYKDRMFSIKDKEDFAKYMQEYEDSKEFNPLFYKNQELKKQKFNRKNKKIKL